MPPLPTDSSVRSVHHEPTFDLPCLRRRVSCSDDMPTTSTPASKSCLAAPARNCTSAETKPRAGPAASPLSAALSCAIKHGATACRRASMCGGRVPTSRVAAMASAERKKGHHRSSFRSPAYHPRRHRSSIARRRHSTSCRGCSGRCSNRRRSHCVKSGATSLSNKGSGAKRLRTRGAHSSLVGPLNFMTFVSVRLVSCIVKVVR